MRRWLSLKLVWWAYYLDPEGFQQRLQEAFDLTQQHLLHRVAADMAELFPLSNIGVPDEPNESRPTLH